MDIKELKKITAFMRKAGITRLEKGDLKLELSPEAPVKPKRNQKQLKSSEVQEDLIPTDSLSEEELLFYSAGGVPPEFKES